MESQQLIPLECSTCKWYASFEGVCTNGDSEHRADIIDRDDFCKYWYWEGESK